MLTRDLLDSDDECGWIDHEGWMARGHGFELAAMDSDDHLIVKSAWFSIGIKARSNHMKVCRPLDARFLYF